VVPQRWDHWDKFGMRPALQGLRSEAGEEMVLRDNFFIEQILPRAILRTLSAEEMAEYRRPFAAPGEGRRPTLTWPRQIPIEGEPTDVVSIVAAYAEWLKTSADRGDGRGDPLCPGGFAGRDRAGHRPLDGGFGLIGAMQGQRGARHNGHGSRLRRRPTTSKPVNVTIGVSLHGCASSDRL